MATLKERYGKLEHDRRPYLDRAQACSKLTLPTMYPEDGANSHTEFRTPYQGIGARGVNNLASKMTMALVPAGSSFFQLGLDDAMYQQLEAAADMDRPEADALLAKIERRAKKHAENVGARKTAFEIMKHLVVGGNALSLIDSEGRLRMYGLQKFVVLRDASGSVRLIIVKERVAKVTLDEETLTATGADQLEDEEVDVFTGYERTAAGWKLWQEINETMVPGSEGTDPKDTPRFVALRWTAPTGEHYGRGHVEELFGDLKSYEGLSKAILQATAAAAKVVFGARKGTGTLKRRFAKAEGGDIVDMDEGDIFAVSLDKYGDFRVALEQAANLERRLSQSFLLNSSVQRDAERVTAEEIRFLAAELEDVLGGVYSVLGTELQLPWAKRWMRVLTKKNLIPALPEGSVDPMVTTGIDALGRNRDLAKLDAVIQRLSPLGPEILDTYLDIGGYIARVAASAGVEQDGLIRSEEEIEQRRERMSAQQAMQQGAPGVMQELIKQAGGQQSG